jgi:hypothetical protein
MPPSAWTHHRLVQRPGTEIMFFRKICFTNECQIFQSRLFSNSNVTALKKWEAVSNANHATFTDDYAKWTPKGIRDELNYHMLVLLI